MAMIRVDPVEVHVRTGWFDGSPREITWGDERLPVTRLTAVREEAAAFPVITGPRTLFEVETPRARLALTYQHRSRRWTITALDEERRGRLRATEPPSTPARLGARRRRRDPAGASAPVPRSPHCRVRMTTHRPHAAAAPSAPGSQPTIGSCPNRNVLPPSAT